MEAKLENIIQLCLQLRKEIETLKAVNKDVLLDTAINNIVEPCEDGFMTSTDIIYNLRLNGANASNHTLKISMLRIGYLQKNGVRINGSRHNGYLGCRLKKKSSDTA